MRRFDEICLLLFFAGPMAVVVIGPACFVMLGIAYAGANKMSM